MSGVLSDEVEGERNDFADEHRFVEAEPRSQLALKSLIFETLWPTRNVVLKSCPCSLKRLDEFPDSSFYRRIAKQDRTT